MKCLIQNGGGLKKPGIQPNRIGGAILCILILLLLSGCLGTSPSLLVTEGAKWDTTMAIEGINPLTEESMQRAMVSPGSNGRLQEFVKKCNAGGDMRIGFIGGSVTAGAAASQPSRRYSTQFCRFLGKLFPNARFLEFNTGIGATDSRFGVSRIREDLLSNDPDLIVIDYAVNDDPTDTTVLPKALEGLIRQCLVKPDVAVMLYFTLRVFGQTSG